MKLPAIVFAGSLVANVALITVFAINPSSAPIAVRSFFESREAHEQRLAAERQRVEQIAARERRASAAAEAANQAKLWSHLASDDLRTLVQRLRAAGFPPSIIRSVVSSEINRQFAGRLKALTAEADQTPYWKPSPMGLADQKLMTQRSQLIRERTRLTRDVLGDDYFAGTGIDPTAAQRSQYGNLPKDKTELVQRIVDDYADMTADVRNATRGITLPEDREKLALLEREKHNDLAAVLSPQELEDYDMRSSPITMRLKSGLTLMDASESEFRTIYGIEKPYAEQLFPGIGGSGGITYFTSDMMQQRREAQKEVSTQLAAALGPARATEFERDISSEFQQLARVATAQKMPIDAAIHAFDLRNSAAEQSGRIADDNTMTVEQKRAALQTLAQTTKTQLVGTLGETAGTAYVNSARWLQAIEHGSAVTFNGTSTSFRPVRGPAPSPGH
jgi:hypothetical protein